MGYMSEIWGIGEGGVDVVGNDSSSGGGKVWMMAVLVVGSGNGIASHLFRILKHPNLRSGQILDICIKSYKYFVPWDFLTNAFCESIFNS